MPFTKDNRMSTLLIITIVIVIIVGVTGITSVSNHSTSNSTPIITSIVGFVGITINQFLGMLRQEMSRREQVKRAEEIKGAVETAATHAETAKNTAVETKEQMATDLKEIKDKVNGNLETAVDKAVQAERSQILDHVSLPKTREELESMIESVVEKACEKFTKK